MRILHLSNHCVFGNGNVHAAVDVACEQAKHGHDVFFASAGGDFEALLTRNGVKHIKLDHPTRSNPFLGFAAIWNLKKICTENRIQIVHAHMMTGAVLGWAATRLQKIPLVTTVHNAFDKHATLMGLGDRVIAVSQAVAKTMKARGINGDKIRTVINGTLGSERTSGDIVGQQILERPSITTVCGLHDRKGVRYLLEAFEIVYSRFPEAHLYIVGEGPQEAEYRAVSAAMMAKENVHFLGQVRDPRGILTNTDIFALASLQDPCPLVIPEAREMGCAIVATNVDGIPEMLAVGDAGVLVAPKDSVALADAIDVLIADPNLLSEQKKKSKTGNDYFFISRVYRETMDAYESVII